MKRLEEITLGLSLVAQHKPDNEEYVIFDFLSAVGQTTLEIIKNKTEKCITADQVHISNQTNINATRFCILSFDDDYLAEINGATFDVGDYVITMLTGQFNIGYYLYANELQMVILACGELNTRIFILE